jgi:hypothetical protein
MEQIWGLCLTDLDANVTGPSLRVTDLRLLTMFLREPILVWLSVGDRICMCEQDKFSTLLPWFESVATLYLHFRKFRFQFKMIFW